MFDALNKKFFSEQMLGGTPPPSDLGEAKKKVAIFL
jgi:hypothetical protein